MVTRGFLFTMFLFAWIQALPQDGTIIGFDSELWSFSGNEYKIIQEEGASVLQFTGGVTNAYLKDADFTNGIITFEVKASKERTFLGCNFRMQDLENYEDFYIRPHQSGNPDATQYCPVYNSQSAWQLYHGVDYARAVTFQFNEWIPVKIIVNNARAEIYFYNETEPSFYIPYLQRKIDAGMIGLWGGTGKFRNFTFVKNAQVSLKSKPKEDESPQPGTIIQWYAYSDLFSEEQTPRLIKTIDLNTWDTIKTDSYGRLNLAKKFKLSKSKNTALVKFKIEAKADTLMRMDFGFSDRVIIYVNNSPIYKGDNTFRTRDYRFLGSIGFFDSVFLPLKKGQNEVIFEVSENFGGWGVLAKIVDSENLKILNNQD